MLFLIGLNSGRKFRSGKAWWWDQWARPQPCFVYGLQWGCGAFVVVFVVGLLTFLVRFVLCRLRWCRAIPAVHTPSLQGGGERQISLGDSLGASPRGSPRGIPPGSPPRATGEIPKDPPS